jgi:lipopolysaccharide/colanic/teichoic acid biosynthesis glycosyltransferase
MELALATPHQAAVTVPETALPAPRIDAGAVAKRAADVAVSLVALLVLLPLFLVLAAAVRLESKGSPIFRQRRVGRDGQTFEILKLRTMVDGAHALRSEFAALNEARDGLFKISADPRVTRIGRLLRKLHMDELPQLVNVLKGEMSLVGPRPLVEEEDALIPVYLRASGRSARPTTSRSPRWPPSTSTTSRAGTSSPISASSCAPSRTSAPPAASSHPVSASAICRATCFGRRTTSLKVNRSTR